MNEQDEQRAQRKDSPLLIVLSGPSGVGKDAVIQGLRACGTRFYLAITATTRPPRANERHGVDYFFYGEEHFKRLIDRGSLIEYARVYGHYKGVPRDQVEQALMCGEDVLVRPDVLGALVLRTIFPDALLILLIPESLEQLSFQLHKRGTDSVQEIATRVSAAASELSHSRCFDRVVKNRDGELSRTVSHVQAIIQAEKSRSQRPCHVPSLTALPDLQPGSDG